MFVDTTLVITVLTVIAVIITYISSFNGGKPTCDRYVLNTYLYLATSLLLLNWFIQLISRYYPAGIITRNTLSTILFVLAYIGVFVAVLYTPKEYLITKHLLWLLFIGIAAVMFAELYKRYDNKSINLAILLVAALFIIMSFIAWRYKESIQANGIGWTLLGVFVLLTIVQYIVQYYYPSSIATKLIITALIGMVCYFIAVDTKIMFDNASTCTSPDYIGESAGFFTHILYVFTQILNLKNN